MSEDFKRLAKSNTSVIIIEIQVGEIRDIVTARGCDTLTFEDQRSMVIRKSNYTCRRTLAILADKAAADLDRELVKRLQQGEEARVLIKVSGH